MAGVSLLDLWWVSQSHFLLVLLDFAPSLPAFPISTFSPSCPMNPSLGILLEFCFSTVKLKGIREDCLLHLHRNSTRETMPAAERWSRCLMSIAPASPSTALTNSPLCLGHGELDWPTTRRHIHQRDAKWLLSLSHPRIPHVGKRVSPWSPNRGESLFSMTLTVPSVPWAQCCVCESSVFH